MGPREGLFHKLGEEVNTEVDFTRSDPMGYDSIAEKYRTKKWDILRVHQFIRNY